jgi:putative solute:sodium symporter small subunit
MTDPPAQDGHREVSGGDVPDGTTDRHDDRPSVTDPETRARHAEYWRRNIRYLGALITVWFVVSFGLGIVLAEPLNNFMVPGTGFPVGFWFAQQGSIYVFVVLIFVYVWLMNRLDREFGVDEGGES